MVRPSSDIKFSDSSVISLDIIKKQIRCKIKAHKIKHIQEELDDDEISSILNDIDYDIDRKTELNSTPKFVFIVSSLNPIPQTLISPNDHQLSLLNPSSNTTAYSIEKDI